jgi:hypothetical protein
MASNLVTNLQSTPYPLHSVTVQGAYEPFELQVSRGQIMGHTPIYIFGLTTVLGSTAYGPLWEGLTPSGGNYVYPSTAAVMYIYSSNAADTAVTIQINGLDANYNILTEQIVLQGTTAVATTNAYFRINGMTTVAGNAVGNVSLYSNSAKTGGTLYAQITAGNGNSQMSIFTVPNGFTFYQTNLQANTNTSLTSGVYNKVRVYANPPIPTGIIPGVVPGPFTTLLQSVFANAFNAINEYPLAVPQKTDIQWELLSSSGSNTTANLYIGGVLIQNDGQALASAI